MDLGYTSLTVADIEVQKVFKGMHSSKRQLKHNTITKLISGNGKRLTSIDSTHSERGCDGDRSLHSLQIGHPYVLIGNFNEGRLFVNGCEYLQMVMHMRIKEHQSLQHGITC